MPPSPSPSLLDAYQRQQDAEKALADYDFGLMVTDTGNWIPDGQGRLSCRVMADDEQGMAVPLVFHVDIPDDPQAPVAAIAYDLRSGEEIGCAQ